MPTSPTVNTKTAESRKRYHNMPSILDTYKSFSTMEKLTEELNTHHIYIRKNDDGRIMFESNLNDTSVPTSSLRTLLKGVILDTIDERVVSLPARYLRYYDTVKKKDLGDRVANGNLYYAEDGTTITLYKFDGILQLSSSNSMDITSFKWNTNNSMAELLMESLQATEEGRVFIKTTKLRLLENGVLAWDLVDTFSLTIGFHNNKIHPSSSSNKAWFIGCYNLSTESEEKTYTNEDIFKLTTHKTIESEDLDKLIGDTVMNKLINKCNRDINIDQIENFYGYIIESMDEKIFIPSLFYKTLRNILYVDVGSTMNDIISEPRAGGMGRGSDFPRVSGGNEHRVLLCRDRYKYNLLLNVIENQSSEHLEIFKKLSPEFKDYIVKCMSSFDILELYIKLSLSNILSMNKTGHIPYHYNKLVNKVTTEILSSEVDIHKSGNDEKILKVIRTYLYNKKYIKDFMVLLNK